MISDLTLRLITTALFGYVAAYCVYRLTTAPSWIRPNQRSDLRRRTDHLLHLAMAAAMIAMAWPTTSTIALTPLAVFFSAATVWFLWRSVTSRAHAKVCAYHAAMMASMVWMYAVMSGWTGHSAHGDHSGHGMDMGGMNTGGMDMNSASQSAGTPGWVAAVSLALTVGFAIAALVWLSALFTSGRRQGAARRGVWTPSATLPRASARTAALACEVAMASGMAVMMAAL